MSGKYRLPKVSNYVSFGGWPIGNGGPGGERGLGVPLL